MRKRIFEIIEVAKENDTASKIYDIAMMCTIVLSMIPLLFKEQSQVFFVMDLLVAIMFANDYILRWYTADYKIKKGWLSFLLFPFTFMALIDLLCILPSFVYIGDEFKVIRMFRFFVAFRAFKFFRYSKSLRLIVNVVVKHRKPLLTVFGLAFAYIFLAALIVFNVEPDTFKNFFEALYWATISLATVGYGDIVPTSVAGRFFTMISSIVGMAVIALPSGIITAAYLTEYNKETGENISSSI